MSNDDVLATCASCGGEAKPSGPMRHRFVDVNFQPIRVLCARELTPQRVAEGEEMNRQWGPDNDEDG
jgi:hypothetical protein